ncbi:MAG: hypothetical protein AAGJ82_10545 [Bacteroidota bacterium]
MARIKLTKEFKEAITQLPDREKDKLLFRLVAKDAALVERLEYELLEGAETQEERRNDVARNIDETLEDYETYFYSPGYLLLELRALSAEITRHIKATKDKYGEVYLNFILLNRALERFGKRIASFSTQKARTLNDYVVKRALKIEKLIEKLHEDYRLDFADDWKQLTALIRSIPTMKRTADWFNLEL